MKKLVIAGLAAALVCAVTAVIILKGRTARPKPGSMPPASESRAVPPVVSEMLRPAVIAGSPKSTRESPQAEVPGNAKAQSAGQNSKPAGKAKDPLTDPLARVALSLVGEDLDAEIYWMAAINDPSLPPSERQDLIEDLNQEGFADPKHPTQQELALILSRIEIIEELWPWAMDQTNWEAFYEAYKDLWNLADIADGGGEPVK